MSFFATNRSSHFFISPIDTKGNPAYNGSSDQNFRRFWREFWASAHYTIMGLALSIAKNKKK
jgi:hypothetical protein